MKAGVQGPSAKTADLALHSLVNGDNTHSEGVPKCRHVEAQKEKRVSRWHSAVQPLRMGWYATRRATRLPACSSSFDYFRPV